jgi:hypothetical protein
MNHIAFILFIALPAAAPPLPRADGAKWPPVRERCRKMLQALRAGGDALPPGVEKRLAALLAEDVKDGDAALLRLQDLLDPLCLAAVHINPESRVKAIRGPADAELTRDRPTLLLVKVHNEAGITPRLQVGGDGVRVPGKAGAGRWLEVAILRAKPLGPTLTGGRLEYVLLRLTAREAGKREATLTFDAGQGTQDLGFRAEVPILFRIRP